MVSLKRALVVGWVFVALTAVAGLSEAQVSVSARPLAENVIVPQSRVIPIPRPIMPRVPRPEPGVQITEIDAVVAILQQMATTTLDISLKNPGRRRQEAELIVPVPKGAVVRGFTFQGAGKEPTATILPKEEAKRIYDEIVAKARDPALLEFIGYNLIRSSVFPVEAGGTQKVRLVYEHLLPADGDRIDYDLPRSESLEYTVPWNISVTIKSKRPISTVYSPSHKIETTRKGHNEVAVNIASDARTEPGSFRLSYLLERNGVTASLLAYPDPKVGGGYFLLLAGLPAELPRSEGGPAIKREVTLVIDRSGSMNGEKIEQVREAALQVLAGLEDGEAFNLIVYHSTVDLFSEQPVIKSGATVRDAREYLKTIKARGGTNIHDALIEALRQRPVEGMLPIVLFLTDGLPTVGNTSEAAIRDVAIKANPHKRRIFTFGVGVDVNTPLLDKIAQETRATACYVLPKEDVEVKVAQVFKRLSGPVLADPELKVSYRDSAKAIMPVKDMIPARLPDLFEGDQLVLLGQYLNEEPVVFEIGGNYLGRPRKFTFTFGFDQATTKNAFVPRLWASRKISLLIDAIRQLGAETGTVPGATPPASDPKLKELVDEIVRLSTEFGILTEYTAFLAREGTNLAAREEVFDMANANFEARAMRTRSGMASVNQDFNNAKLMWQSQANVNNYFYDQKMNRVAVANVQQVNDRAFYRRGNRWVDSRVVTREDTVKPSKVIAFGSKEFSKLAERLARENRQGCIALRGEILMEVDGETVLVK